MDKILVDAMEEYANQFTSEQPVLPRVSQIYPIAFVVWYSGMRIEQIEKAFERWQDEQK